LRVQRGRAAVGTARERAVRSRGGRVYGCAGREGRFEAADGGTLFLDEIGNLSLAGQAKLLRVLQTGEFERLGSSQTRRVARARRLGDQHALADAIKQGRFREDLYYRLNVIELAVPPLAERREDVLPLARHSSSRLRAVARGRARAAAPRLPGNVRELRNSIRRACLLAPAHRIEAQDLVLPSGGGAGEAVEPPREARPRRDRGRAGAPRRRGRRAARDLGLSRQSLYRRMEKLGIAVGPTDESLRHAGAHCDDAAVGARRAEIGHWRWPRCSGPPGCSTMGRDGGRLWLARLRVARRLLRRRERLLEALATASRACTTATTA